MFRTRVLASTSTLVLYCTRVQLYYLKSTYSGTWYVRRTARSISLFSRGSGALLGREIDVSIGQGVENPKKTSSELGSVNVSELFYWFSPSCGFDFPRDRVILLISSLLWVPVSGNASVRVSVYASVLPFALFYFTQREQCGGSWYQWTTVVWSIATMGDQLNFFQGFLLVALCAKA